MNGVGLVLTYHRIGTDAVDPWRLQVTPARFREHLHVLRTLGGIVPLSHIGIETSRPRFAITVDDGYADTLSVLAQELARADAPATAFVVSNYVGHREEYWWDALEQLLEDGDGPQHTPPTEWRAWEQPTTVAQHAYRRAVDTMRATAPHDQRRTLDLLLGARGSSEARKSRRVVTEEELRAAASSTLIEVGSHTRSHPVLSRLTPSQQQHELAGAHACLSEMLERPLHSLAYPFGQRTDYTEDSVAITARLGLRYACSNITGVVTHATSPLELPRWQVHECDGDEFARHISQLAS